MKDLLHDLIPAACVVAIIATVVRVAVCVSNRPCGTTVSRTVEVDGGADIDPGKLLDGVTVFHWDGEPEDDDTDGGVK
jgi:hypothetical protein